MAADQVLTVAEMRAAEQALINGGSDVHELMQRAGRGAADWVWRMAAGRSVTVLCGPGNNGGDGYVIAETLRQRGVAVQVIAALPPATDAAKHARSKFGGQISAPADNISGGIFVDCLFGSGLTRALSAELAELLVTLARAHKFRIAIDVPSGVESDSGEIFGPNQPYDLTLALGAWKRAHFLMPAMASMGTLRLVDIGIAGGAGVGRNIQKPVLTRPPAAAHKYQRGLLAIVGGAMPGAGVLAATAAMHAGAGYVKLLTDKGLGCEPSELVIDNSELSAALGDKRINAVLAGPGLGRDSAATKRLGQVLAMGGPAVLDADALFLLTPEMIAGRSAPLVITPHEGELAALETSFEIKADESKAERAGALAAMMGAVVIAKGPDTVVAAPDGRLAFGPRASPWLSAAGTGDVLAGIVASRLANGAAPFDAACQGVWLHGQAAHLAGFAFTAAELAQQVRHAYSACL
ncbi:NAD(P)H-hydrate dehydratase [Altererythrobacter confluentis]|uniref:Bifunctional NAD(P)H-hydrate repair enzyme n=1 Tax=Allopontixanthobacter confluentis TaxID=1849021 RepID=A0A6L7GEB0_9SPHN|nr:NAD(P)H-hydrate dehydratase [Allopontixanthobacter confluentis]MXP14267.1 NAD(P)H-hydrate dehydratase [Allopontixanthobacter confluentis]